MADINEDRPNAADLANKAEREAAYRAENASPLERAARAIGEAYDGYADPVDTPNNWARAMDGARAALMAIREPSEAMYDAARAWARDGCGCPCCVTADNWQTMIDAALEKSMPSAGSTP